METIEKKQKSLIDRFARFSSWEERYKYIIELGKSLVPLKDRHKTEKNRIKGCQSQAWLYADLEHDQVIYQGDSDAMIVRGLVKILLNVFSGHKPADIVKAGTDFLNEMGLTAHLSRSRANGLGAMVRQFKNYAIAFDVLVRNRQN